MVLLDKITELKITRVIRGKNAPSIAKRRGNSRVQEKIVPPEIHTCGGTIAELIARR
jgi:hypothetical protein